MKIFFFATTLLIISNLFAQPNTEVYLMDLEVSEESFNISNFRNISNNKGYDNQPSFIDENTLLLVKNNKGQTDIAVFNNVKNKTHWLNKKTEGGEYSPQIFKNKTDIAAVRLDSGGLQRLYHYDVLTGENKELIKNLQVAYYAFYNKDTLLATVLSADRLDLVVHSFQNKKTDTLLENVGRSIHKVPNSDAMSYPAINEEGNLDIYQLDMKTQESFFVTQLPIGIQDYVWINDSKILIGSGDKLYLYNLFGSGDWKQVTDLSIHKIKNITRLAISPNGNKLALVAESTSN